MRKAIIALSFIIVQAHFCFAGPGPRQRLSMDFNWKFSLTDTIGADKTAFNDSRWRTLDLPHDWSIENEFIENTPTGGRGGYLPTGVGWYRKHFALPASVMNKNIRIEFDGVYQNSDVWINGNHLGHYPNGYMSFYYDLTPYVKKGENIIVVRVDNSLQPNTRWYSGSGIYRHVWLTISDPLHIAQWGTYITTPVVNQATATIAVKTTIDNTSRISRDAILRSIILNGSGDEVARTESSFSIQPGRNIEVEQRMTLATPSLWSLEDPSMYSMHSVILEKNRTLDEYVSSFGIRDIKYDVDKGFLLNGLPVKMRGVCLHHDAGSVGSAVPEAMWVRRLQLLKEMGCNAIRTSHNPVAPEFLNLCDRMGFLVQNEIFDEWTSPKVKYGYSNYFAKWSQHDLVGFIHRDRNHPSVVMWSAGNEIGEQRQEKGYEILAPLIATFHREDPTRPVTTGNDNIAADNGSAKLPFLQMLDIVGYNYVDRWHERRELFYSIDRHDHPDWKMVGTESVSIPGVRGNYFGGGFLGIDSSVIRPANMSSVIRAEQLWKFVSIHDYVIGDFMWTGIDYLGEARWPNKNSSSGVIDLCGFPKDAYYFYQSQWTEKPMIHLAPHWNWPSLQKGKVIPVLAYTNCDSVELFLNGKSFGIKSLEFPRQGNSGGWNRYERPLINITTGDLHLTWDVPYEPGVLKAVGRKNGKIVCEETIRTTGEPASVRLSVDHDTIQADARDVAHVKIEIVDSNGDVVPVANNQVQIKVEGAGKLIGLDNGNPVDHTSMKSNIRNVFNGLALAVVQSNRKPGLIRIIATSPGIQSASISVGNRQSAVSSRLPTDTAELVLDAKAMLGEGSIWQPKENKLYWIDIEGKSLHIYDPETKKDKVFPVGSRIGTVVPARDGDALVALQNGIHKINTKTGKLDFLINPLPDTNLRFNDGKCDPSGRFWVGSMALDSRKKGAVLYRFDKDKSIHVMLDSVAISNGIVWTADKKTMYYNDTPTGTIQGFDYDDKTGSISNRRVAVLIPKGSGAPDGMTIDSDGNLWVALWGGGCVAKFDPLTGKLLQKIKVPAPNVSSCAFGGKNLETLYITTARAWVSPEKLKEFPLSGGLFSVKPGVHGVPAEFYKGH